MLLLTSPKSATWRDDWRLDPGRTVDWGTYTHVMSPRSLGILTTWQPQSPWTSYMAALDSKSKCSREQDRNWIIFYDLGMRALLPPYSMGWSSPNLLRVKWREQRISSGWKECQTICDHIFLKCYRLFLLLPAFYRWGKWGMEMQSNLSKTYHCNPPRYCLIFLGTQQYNPHSLFFPFSSQVLPQFNVIRFHPPFYSSRSLMTNILLYPMVTSQSSSHLTLWHRETWLIVLSFQSAFSFGFTLSCSPLHSLSALSLSKLIPLEDLIQCLHSKLHLLTWHFQCQSFSNFYVCIFTWLFNGHHKLNLSQEHFWLPIPQTWSGLVRKISIEYGVLQRWWEGGEILASPTLCFAIGGAWWEPWGINGTMSIVYVEQLHDWLPWSTSPRWACYFLSRRLPYIM